MSILIGLHISRSLTANNAIKDKIGNRLFPLVVPLGVDKFPYIVYDTTGSTGDMTKDGSVEDTATVQLSVVAKGYREALELAQLVRYELEGKNAEYDEFIVKQDGGVQYNDEYIEQFDAYAVNLVIGFKTIDK